MRSTEEIEEPSSPAITSRFPLISIGFQWFAAVRWGEKGGRPGRLSETDFSKATSGGGDLMMQEGLLAEAKQLYPKRQLNALNTVGYKELFRYFDQEIELEFAISEIKKNTRRFAKRQLTWFRKNNNIHWFDYTTKPEQIMMFLSEEINALNK